MRDRMADIWAGIVTLVIIGGAVVVTIVFAAWMYNAIIKGAGSESEVSGVVTKVYTLSCQSCTTGFATIRHKDGQMSAVEMSGANYGLVNVGDFCTFKVGNFDYANSVHCEPNNNR